MTLDPETLERLELARTIAGGLTYDVARLIAGWGVDFDEYVDSEIAQRLRDSIEPSFASGNAMAPNFGHDAHLKIVVSEDSLVAVVFFADSSATWTESGEVIGAGARFRWRFTIFIDPRSKKVVDYRLQPEPREGSPV